MNGLGFRNSLLVSILALVALSVTISSYFSYSEQSKSMTELITASTKSFVAEQAAQVQSKIEEKVGAVGKLAARFKVRKIEGDAAQIVELTQVIADAANLNSALIAKSNGDAYWNQTSATWPNHKYDGDATTRSWYQAAQNSNGTALTDPYLSSDGNAYWVSIVEQTKGGMLSVDMQLSFMAKMVHNATRFAGSTAIIMGKDTTVLATSTSALKMGQKGTSIASLKDKLLQVGQHDELLQEYTLNGVEKLMFSKKIVAGDKEWFYILGLDKEVAFADLTAAREDAIIVAVTTCLLSLGLAFMAINILYRPILALKETILNLSSGDGDLTQRLEVKSQDDLGQMASGINAFISSLQSMMLNVESYTVKLQQDVAALTTQTQNNSSILSQHVVETEQIVTAIEEMNSTAESVANHAAETAELTATAAAMGGESSEVVVDAQSKVSSLVGVVENTANSIREMSEETEGINSVLGVIGGIAEQTNLLALNAAIEAARAGEQGRGFAVVADEVRALASRTQTSTGEIEAALSSLITRSQSVSNSMEATKTTCDETYEKTELVGNRIQSLTSHISEVNDLSTQIATAAEEQSSVTQEVSRNMTSINDMVAQLDSIGRDTEQQTESIANTNREIGQLVGSFKLR